MEEKQSSISDFEIISMVGKGAFCNVYKVRRKIDGEFYAMKKVDLKTLTEKERDNAFNEVKILANINCENIISYKDSFIDKATHTLYLIMEYASYGDLDSLIEKHKKNREYFRESELLNIIKQIVVGLKALHSHNVLHRDLKSANIFICDENCTKIKIGDLNVSKVINSINLRNTQTGTPYYASPEVWNNVPYDFKSDIWSLGCLIYEMTALKPPFKGASMTELYNNIIRGYIEPIPRIYSGNLSRIIQMCLRQSDKLRPTAAELYDFIENLTARKDVNNGNIISNNNNGLEKPKYVPFQPLPRINHRNTIDRDNYSLPQKRYKSELRARPITANLDRSSFLHNQNQSIAKKNLDKSLNHTEEKRNHSQIYGRKPMPPLKKLNYHYMQGEVQKEENQNKNKEDFHHEKEGNHFSTPNRMEKINNFKKLNPRFCEKMKYRINPNVKPIQRVSVTESNQVAKNKIGLNKIANMRNKLSLNEEMKEKKKEEVNKSTNDASAINALNDNKVLPSLDNKEVCERSKSPLNPIRSRPQARNYEELNKEIEDLLKINIEQSKQIAENTKSLGEQRAHSAISIRNRSNCSDNIRKIFEGYSLLEQESQSNISRATRDKSPLPSLALTKNNNSIQMFKILNHQIRPVPMKLPSSGSKRQVHKIVINHSSQKSKLKNVKSKVGEMIRSKSKPKITEQEKK